MNGKLRFAITLIVGILISSILVCYYFPVLTVIAADNIYVESVCTFSADSVSEAETKCKKAGYIPTQCDMNASNGNPVLLGYKTTTNKNQAISKLSILHMDHGYHARSTNDVLNLLYDDADDITKTMMIAIHEYASNLEKGSPLAQDAKEKLNFFYIPSGTSSIEKDVLLGDYLASNECNISVIKRLICHTTSFLISVIFKLLVQGVADWSDTGNWITRFVENVESEKFLTETKNEENDLKYTDDAEKLIPRLKEFYNDYQKAKEFNSEEKIKELAESIKSSNESSSDDSGFSQEEKSNMLHVIFSYNTLNSYKIQHDGQSIGVGDYICSLGNSEYKSTEDIRMIYPFVVAFSKGQLVMTQVLGISSMVDVIKCDNEFDGEKVDIENYKKEKTELGSDIKEEIIKYNKEFYSKENCEVLSVWEYAQNDFPANAKVGITNSMSTTLQSENETLKYNANHTILHKIDKILEKISLYIQFYDVAYGVIRIIVAVVCVIKGLGLVSMASFFKGLLVHTTNCILICILNGLYYFAIIGWYIGVIISLISLIWFFGKILYKCFWQEEEDTIKYTTNDIPDIMFDSKDINKKKYVVRYDCVKDYDTNKSADLNASDGKRFSALYYSKDECFGERIKVNNIDNDVFVIKNNNTVPVSGGYKPVTYLTADDEMDSAVNLNSYSKKKNTSGLFLFYSTEVTFKEDKKDEGKTLTETDTGTKDEKTENVDVNIGVESPPTEGQEGLYLDSIYIVNAKTETEAKNCLVNEGYKYMDMNLTPSLVQNEIGRDISQPYTYLGYTTTEDKSNAVTDIRVLPPGFAHNQEMYFGESKYTIAGCVKTLSDRVATLYYTKSKSAGTPIYPDLQIIKGTEIQNQGFEPVNLFSGGDAFNINNVLAQADGYPPVNSNSGKKNSICIFFHPSIIFTSGEKYIGGLSFFRRDSSRTDLLSNPSKVVEFAVERGFTFFDNCLLTEEKRFEGDDVILDKKPKGHQYYRLNLAYSTTFNPYRAIYSIKSYESVSPNVTSLNENIIDKNIIGFMACKIFFYEAVLKKLPDILFENTWCTNCMQNEDDPCKKNLYLSGKIKGMKPLKETDVEVTDIANKSGMYGVRDITNPNSSTPANIGHKSFKKMYLLIKGDEPKQKKYISSLKVSSWNVDRIVKQMGEFYDGLDDDSKEKIIDDLYKNREDSSFIGAINSFEGEVINKNLAVSFDDSVQHIRTNTPNEVAYVGVSRTDDKDEAIRSIIKFKPKSKNEVSEKIKVGGIEYYRAYDNVFDVESVHDSLGEYYLYYSTSKSSGNPITSIDFSKVPLVDNSVTARTTHNVDEEDYINDNKVTATTKCEANETNYIHSTCETEENEYLTDIFIGEGNNSKEAMLDLLNMGKAGCNKFINVNLNEGASGKCLYIGYDTSNKYRSVKDIICTVGKPPQEDIVIDGVTYKRARDHYMYAKDHSHAISLNSGTDGLQVYLYYNNYEKSEIQNPIYDLAVAQRDYNPNINGETIWENILKTSGKRCDLNAGVCTVSGAETDIRLFLYACREKNGRKNVAVEQKMNCGELVLK